MSKIYEQENHRQRSFNIIKHLRLMDDIFFRCCLKDNIPVAECMLRIILAKHDLKIITMQVEYVIPSLQGRSVRLDVHAIDNSGKEYDIEMQRADKGASQKRARFNSSLLDLNSLKKGEDFTKLPETYVIFITENDVLGKGSPRYHINRFVEEGMTPFNDGAHIIFVNGSYEGQDDIGKLMHDFRSRNADDILLEPLKETVNRYKNNPEEVSVMDKELQAWLNEERAAGEAQGTEKTQMSSIRALMKNAGVTAEKAMELLSIDKSLWQKYLAML